MSTISRLPDTTTRLLGSPLVITTPVTLVKELLDNSIDAKATSINVIISADTVKKIEVRDNGVGIHPDDYDSLGRRGHTSKLRSFDELRTHSGKTLGFRGEALASANSLAQITVTTKIASEPVAAILHVIQGTGGVSKQQRASAPVGTSVSITGLFGNLPVREQVAIKESAKSLDHIRELLRSYAMARPQLKLSLKVLQSPKHNWSFSPKPGSGVREAAIQLFGAELATHGFEKTFDTGNTRDIDGSSGQDKDPSSDNLYSLEAFILRPGIDPSKTPKQRYFSVDGRPVAAKRGTMKKLMDIYIGYFNATLGRNPSDAKVKDCFIRLNINCPPGSYDVNIEPSKNDVLFSDEEAVLDGFTGLCKEVYPETTLESRNSQLPAKHNSILNMEDDLGPQESSSAELQVEPTSQVDNGSDSSLEIPNQTMSQLQLSGQSQEQQLETIDQPPSDQMQGVVQCSSSSSIIGFTPINSQSSTAQSQSLSIRDPGLKDVPSNTRHDRYKVDMSTDLNEYSHDSPRKRRSQPSHTVPIRQQKPDVMEYSSPQYLNPFVIAKMNAPRRNGDGHAITERVHENGLSPPILESPMTPDPPILHHTKSAPRDLDVPPSQRYFCSRNGAHQLRPGVPGGPYRSPITSPQGIASQKATDGTKISPAQRLRRRRDNLPWSPPSSVERALPSNNHSANIGEQLAPDGMKQTKISFNGTRETHRKRQLQEDGNELNQQEPCGETGLQRMLTSARQNLHHQLSQQKGTCNSLEETNFTNIKEPIKTSLPVEDPRAYLLRRQKSIAAEEDGTRPKKIRRLKSSLLPLENIPSEDQTHSLVVVKKLDSKVLCTVVKLGAMYDVYVKRGAVDSGLDMNLDKGREVEERIRSLLRKRNGMVGGEECEPEINLCSLLKGKGITFGASM